MTKPNSKERETGTPGVGGSGARELASNPMKIPTLKAPRLNPVRALLRKFAARPKPALPPVLPAEPAPRKAITPRGQKILIVDDDVVTLKTTGLKLESEGYEVLAAKDGAAAIHLARHEKPDLILLDLSFPTEVSLSWDGFLIMNWLRRLEETRHIPIIVISSGEAAKYQQRSLSTGATDFFQKPIVHDSLLARIEQTLAGVKPPPRQPGDFQI